ncbi:MAG: ABC transporter permease [Candidatus Eremiobacteraeota bacterium]|nr:ABC transporter permease [Candidatus Eremiobacteraeota bacterium]
MGFKFFTLLRKEVIQFTRNTVLLVIVLYAATLDVWMAAQVTSDLKNFPIAIYDMDKSQKSYDLVRKLRPPYFVIHSYIDDEKKVQDLILGDDVGAVLIIPRKFQDNIVSYRGARVQLVLDATTSNTAEIAAGYVGAIIADFQNEILTKEWQVSTVMYKLMPLIRSETRFAFNPNLNDAWAMTLQEFFTIFTLIAILLPATAMVNEKQFGTIEQLMVTPVKPYEIMFAKVLPMMVVFIFASFICIYTILIPLIHVPFMGSLLEFLIVTTVFCFTASGIGLLVSTLSNNLSETVLLTLLVLFPIMFLSGTWVPPEAMPPWMAFLVNFSPLKYYLDLGYGIILKGNSLLFMWTEFLKLTALGVVVFWIGAQRFKKMFG